MGPEFMLVVVQCACSLDIHVDDDTSDVHHESNLMLNYISMHPGS
jgi:hypothetical protein